jgi:RNA polymerase sigma factor (sigma-70 family)
VTTASASEGLVRELAPRALGAVTRRYGNFADAEDAVQEALMAALDTWPRDGVPDNPLGWLIRVASRRMGEQYRRDGARRRREQLVASWSLTPSDPVSGSDDTLILMFMCCHPSLTPAMAIPLTLRAVGGLTTREIAKAFLVSEPTMAQRISRAKSKVRDATEAFTLPPEAERSERLASMLHVLYLLFNEGYTTSSGSELSRTDLSGEAIRLARSVHRLLPREPEVTGLLAMMLLTDARRPSRTDGDGALVPLSQQDRSRWNRDLIAEGVALVTGAIREGHLGEYQLQAAVAAVHDLALRHEDTDWSTIESLYGRLESMTGNPMVRLNRAVAVAMLHGPRAGLALLDCVGEQLGDHHRLHAVRAHLLGQVGETDAAIAAFTLASERTTNLRERHYLITEAARLVHGDTPVEHADP